MKEKERMLDKNNMTLKLEKMTKSIEKHQISRSELSKKISLQEKGITLIALVVTIIILLILAGVTLNMALSDNGLFSKTQEAADKYQYAQSDEEEMVRQIATQMYSEYVGAEVTGYTPKGTSTTCTLVTENTGYENPQTFSRNENMTWRVWDFDGNTLRLIGEPTEEKLKLKGVKGYNNGVWSMDHICKELYSNEEIGANATTLKRSDILKVSTFDFTKYKHNANDWKAGNDESQSINYGFSKTFDEGTFNYPDIWYSNDKKWVYTKEKQVDKYGEIFETIGNTDGENDKEGINENEKITFKDNYSSANLEGNLINNNYLDLLIGEMDIGTGGYCWLGTRDNEYVKGIAYFSMCVLCRKTENSSEYGIAGLCKSNGVDFDGGCNYSLIPVVSINLNDKGYTLEKDLEKSKEGLDIYNLKFN